MLDWVDLKIIVCTDMTWSRGREMRLREERGREEGGQDVRRDEGR